MQEINEELSERKRIDEIKKRVGESFVYSENNYKNFRKMKKFLAETNWDNTEKNFLDGQKVPTLECNIIEPHISKFLGNFSSQEPSICAIANDKTKINIETATFAEQHLRHELCDYKNDHTGYRTMKDMLYGGFGVAQITTDYKNEMSMQQDLGWKNKKDPTMCFFDPRAEETHKGDGDYCGEVFALSLDELSSMYPKENFKIAKNNYSQSSSSKFCGFNWSYLNGKTKLFIVCDYYEKKKERVKICQIKTGETMKVSEYNKMVKNWDPMTLDPPPAMLGKPRVTVLEKIIRVRLLYDRILEEEETDFDFLPFVFFPGSTEFLSDVDGADKYELTKSYGWNCVGSQKLKNYAMVNLGNELENIQQAKLQIAIEALPNQEEYLAQIKSPQRANVLAFNAFYGNNPDHPIPNPMSVVPRPGCPPEIAQAFQLCDEAVRNTLGAFDSNTMMSNNPISGKGIQELEIQSDSAAKPYLIGYLQGLQRVAQIWVSLMPKYYKTPRTLPIIDKQGKRQFVEVNNEDGSGIQLKYDKNALNIMVEAGANFSIQKNRALNLITSMAHSMPVFGQFINKKCLPEILDNMECRGIDTMQEKAVEFMQELQQQEQQAQQNNPLVMKAQLEQAKLQQDAQKTQAQFQIDMQKLQQAERKVLSDMQVENQKAQVQLVKANTEHFAKEAELKMSHVDQAHRHLKEATELHHKIHSDKGEINNEQQ